MTERDKVQARLNLELSNLKKQLTFHDRLNISSTAISVFMGMSHKLGVVPIWELIGFLQVTWGSCRANRLIFLKKSTNSNVAQLIQSYKRMVEKVELHYVNEEGIFGTFRKISHLQLPFQLTYGKIEIARNHYLFGSSVLGVSFSEPINPDRINFRVEDFIDNTLVLSLMIGGKDNQSNEEIGTAPYAWTNKLETFAAKFLGERYNSYSDTIVLDLADEQRLQEALSTRLVMPQLVGYQHR